MDIHGLVAASGVPRKTIHHYIAERLMEAPPNRSNRTSYDEAHLTRLRAILKLKEMGVYRLDALRERLASMTEEQIHELVHGPKPKPKPPLDASAPEGGEAWRRYVLVPGLELILREGAPPLVQRLASEIHARYRGE